MLKLMIVDDETLFREALKVSIPWGSLGYEVCCEAENGFDALEKIAEYKPDVALVDINMPVMDGLELAAEIKGKELDVKVIIITGYDEFAYARQAIEVGAGHYLLKPIEETELVAALVSIRERIRKERSARLEAEALAQQVNDYKPILREMLLNDLVQGNQLLGNDEFVSLLRQTDVDLSAKWFQVAVIEASQKEEGINSGASGHLWCFAVSSLAKALLEEYCPLELCRDIHGRLNVLLFLNQGGEDLQLSLVNALERVRVTALRTFGVSLSIGIGRPCEQVMQMAVSHQEALLALRNKSAIGDDCVVSYALGSDETTRQSFFSIEQRMQLHLCLRGGDIPEAESIIRSVFSRIRSKKPTKDAARLVCIEIGATLAEVAERANAAKNLFSEGANLLEEALAQKDLDAMEAWVTRLLSAVSSLIQAGGGRRTSKIVEEAIAFIHDNYMKYDLRIDTIAKSVYVKYGHLCFLFKRETGKTINEYISELRISKARELMDGGCHSIALVAAKVGYADANYFGKCFKKLTGISPAKYVENFTAGKN